MRVPTGVRAAQNLLRANASHPARPVRAADRAVDRRGGQAGRSRPSRSSPPASGRESRRWWWPPTACASRKPASPPMSCRLRHQSPRVASPAGDAARYGLGPTTETAAPVDVAAATRQGDVRLCHADQAMRLPCGTSPRAGLNWRGSSQSSVQGGSRQAKWGYCKRSGLDVQSEVIW